MMDKLELANVATKIQIPVPQTSSCASSAELQALLPDMKFPVIIKPRFAYQWRRKGVWDAVGAQKAIIVESAEKLQTEYERLAQFTQEVLLQEYIAGDDRDIVVCGVYIDQAGNVQGHFTGRKLRQNPPLVGTGSIVEACEVDAIVAPSTALLKAFGYAGLAEIEYKLDKNNGKYRLIEINPRHWDQHELGNLVGVNLTWIAYQDLVGMTATKVTPNYGGATTFRWIAETELLQAIVTNLYLQLRSLRNSKTRTRDYFRAVGRTIQDLAGLLRGKKVCGVLSLRDPVPSVLLCSRLLRNAFSFVGRRLRSA
jgi:predicted ATP-grasp superfamily ATP-dependent carboligase